MLNSASCDTVNLLSNLSVLGCLLSSGSGVRIPSGTPVQFQTSLKSGKILIRGKLLTGDEHYVTDHSRQRFITVSVAFAAFMVVLDEYIVNISLPSIAHHFNVSTSIVAHVTLAYLLIITCTLPIFGKIGDRIGLKRIFMLGFCVFVAGSLLCGISNSLLMLVGCRCIQGLGGSMLFSVGTAMIPRYLPEHTRGWAFGTISLFAGLGIALGAPIGGFITELLGWNWIFLLNVPVGIASIFIVNRVIPDDRNKTKNDKKPPSFDIAGSILSFLGLLSFIMALNQGQELGWNSPHTISLFIISAILFTLFIIQEKRYKYPLLDFNLFKIRSYAYATLAMSVSFAHYAGSNFLIPFYLILDKGLSPKIAGLIIMIYAVVYMPVGAVMGRLSDRVSIYLLPSVGLASVTLACVFFVFTLKSPGLLPVIIFTVWLGLSYGTFISSNNNLVMSSVPKNMQGIASGISRTMQHLGMILGISLYETIFSLVVPNASLDTSLSRAAVPRGVLLSGFQYAYIAGAAICSIAFILSLLTRNRKITAN